MFLFTYQFVSLQFRFVQDGGEKGGQKTASQEEDKGEQERTRLT